MRGRSLTMPFVASLTALVLVWAVAAPVAADEVTDLPDVMEVAPLESGPLEIPESITPEGDFSGITSPAALVVGRAVGGPAARAGASLLPSQATIVDSSFDEDTSVLVTQSEYRNLYENLDGTHTLVIGLDPLNAVNDEGDWVPVETQLQKQPDGSFSTDAHPLDPTFAPTADAEGAFSISRGGYECQRRLNFDPFSSSES